MLKAGMSVCPRRKSTLFNAVTRTAKAERRIILCTIDPNLHRSRAGRATLRTAKDCEDEFDDSGGDRICGHRPPGEGASQGEGLGNKFLTHIREVDAIVQVVRWLRDADIHHRGRNVDPVRDIERSHGNWCSPISKRCKNVSQLEQGRKPRKDALCAEAVLKKIEPHLNSGKPPLTLESRPRQTVSRLFWLMTDKPTIFACNVKESDLAPLMRTVMWQKCGEYTQHHFACERLISAQSKRLD